MKLIFLIRITQFNCPT